MKQVSRLQRPVFACLVLWLCLMQNALAQDSAFGNTNGPIDIQSDSLEISQDRNIAIFRGKVVAKQDNSILYANQLEVYYSNRKNPSTGEAEQAVKSLVAVGDVVLEMPDKTARGDKGRYDLATEIIELTGNVVVKQEGTTLTGSEFIADLETGVSKLYSGNTGRVNVEMKAGGS